MSLRGQITPIFLSWTSMDNVWQDRTDSQIPKMQMNPTILTTYRSGTDSLDDAHGHIMQSSRGLPNTTVQPLMEFLRITHGIKCTMYRTPHTHFSKLQICTPHKTYDCQTLLLARPLLSFIILPSQTLTPSVQMHWLKDIKHKGNNLSLKNATDSPLGIRPSNANRHYNLPKT
jgi:hypothetical protein